MPRSALAPLALLALGGLLACDDFETFDTLRCGNGVIEPAADEDCDGLPAGSPFACGLPGSPGACRLVCGGGAPCPEGWRCGRGGLCTAAGGRFEPPVVSRLDGEDLALGDLDGDGLLDAITNQRAALGLAFGRGDGVFDAVDPVPVPVAPVPPAVGDFDGDGRADVGLSWGEGVLVLRGTEVRTLEPMVAPLADAPLPDRVVAVRAAPPFTRHEALLLYATADSPTFEVLGRPLDASALAGRLPAGPPAEVIGVGDLDPGEGRGGDEILLAFAGASTLPIARLDCAEACALTLAQTLALPEGVALAAAGAFVADLDADGWPDVLAQGDGAPLQLLVARGGPQGLGPMTVEASARMGNDGALIRAVGDVAGDAGLELLTSGGLRALSGPVGAGRLSPVWRPRRPMRESGLADLDGDGRLDVYGVEDGSLELAHARGDGEFVQQSAGVVDVEAVRAGDLDGDGRTDLVVRRADGGVSILFGEATGRLSAPVPVAHLAPGPAALRVLRRADTALGGDAVDDLLAFAGGRVFAFSGNAQRRPSAPIANAARPMGLAIGRFAWGPGAFVAGRDQRLDRVDQRLPGAAGDAPALVPLASEGCPADAVGAASWLRAVDWDGDGLDEVLHFDLISAPGGRVGALARVDVGEATARCVAVGALDGPAVPRFVDVLDLDGDGRDDAVALLDPRDGGPDRGPRLALWSGAAFDAPALLDLAPAGGPVEHGAAIDLGAGRRLVLLADGAAQVATVDGGVLRFERLGPIPRGVLGALRADVDGDGLDDLVIKTPTSVLVYGQAACSARSAWDGGCRRREAW